ncbi:MAG: hypothetical protein WBF06_07185 [Candidatus Acidiferrales bacterium]
MPIPAPLSRVPARKKRAPIAALVAMLSAALAVVLLAASPARAQLQPMGGSAQGTPAKSSTSAPAAAHSTSNYGSGSVRVFMSNSASWKKIGGWGLAGQSESGRGDAADADGVKAFEKHCSQYPLTNDRNAASYVILLDQLNEKAPKKGRDKITVYNRAGIAVYGNSTRLLDDSIKDACRAIGGDHSKHHK